MFGRMYDKAWHEVSYYTATALPNQLGLSRKWSKIADRLYLGKIPLRGGDKEEINKFISENGDPLLGLVVSVVKPPEIEEKAFTMDPVRPEEWKMDGVEQVNLPMKDFTAEVDVRLAAEVVFKAQATRDNDKSVYVHCKAGKSRSAMFVSCVLAMFDLLKENENKIKTVEELVELATRIIKTRRPQVAIRQALKDTAGCVVNEAIKMQNKKYLDEVGLSEEKDITLETLSLKERADLCFANPQIKEEIQQMEIYKDLCAYKEELISSHTWIKSKPKRVTHIDKLLQSILDARDSTWYETLVAMKGPASDLMEAAPIVNVYNVDLDKSKRERLIEKLKNDIESLICLNLSCQKHEFREIFPINENKIILRPS